MNRQEVIKLVIKTAFIAIVSIVAVGYLFSKCDAVEHAGALSADIKTVDCESDFTTIHFKIWNMSDDRVPFVRAVVTATDKVTGKESLYEFKDEFGITAKSSIEKDGIIGRFDCSRTKFDIKVYHF